MDGPHRLLGGPACSRPLRKGVLSSIGSRPAASDFWRREMEQVIPWGELAAVIEPYYPKPEGAGRPPVGIERMPAHPLPATLVHSVRSRRGGGSV